jgi:2-amino-4-hydroxy-6-hydroxymethyldihydropteridine diphosphokinase
MVETVYFSLGTNLGNRCANLAEALSHMAAFCQNLHASSVYETEPWGFTDQPNFFNQVIRAETGLPPLPLLNAVKSLELELGREPNFRYGPRLIDIDILLYGSLVLQSDSLTIPHLMLPERAFVLVPLVELAPDLLHPISGQSMKTLLSSLDTSGVKWIQNPINESESDGCI